MIIEEPELEMSILDSCLGIVLCTVFWSFMYFALCIYEPNRIKEMHCRVVTFFHATLICGMCAWSAFIQGPWPYTKPGGPSTYLQQWICIICVGYFLFDFVWCVYFGAEGLTMMIHHLISIIGNFIVIFRGWNGTEMIATIFGTEISNPLLQIRWFLKENGRKDTWAAEIVDILFMLTFGIMRLGLGTHLYYVYFNHPRADIVGKTGGMLIYLVSFAFWINMTQYAVRKYKKMYRNWKLKQAQVNGHSTSNAALKTDEQTNGVHSQNGTDVSKKIN